MDNGAQKIEDAEEVARVKAQARVVYRKTAIAAAVATALAFALPPW